ncbi:hypothetical protein NQ156_02500 [Microbacterium sp. zg.Y625]|uniref:hypothetical protein n=1 Tax=Microbacterium jiangjiandongii TaxID=3049071 RepID=UPI00214C3A4B|nr:MULTISPECIES: hypothetical protein [unclassified Microbacterium]MCR2791928.1 hypothetical protein [Microbacterium sp. zg.Y625]WIM24740.1 hypothetical protein QNO14_11410 [Microbacterium sp. zg-Y625]
MPSDPEPTDERWVYAPTSAFPDVHSYTDLGSVTVDGETFAVRRRDGGSTHLDSIHYDWISGPNDGYGFSTVGISGHISRERQIADIRDFLAGIDPATGYLSYP